MTTKKVAPKKKVSSGSSQPDQTEYWSKQEDYILEATHPHRQLIVDELKKIEPFAGVLEVGCDVGQNLYLVGINYPETQLAGVDVNQRAIDEAKTVLPSAILKVGNAEELPFEDKTFDVVIYDAVLMYVKDVNKALAEGLRVGRKALIIIDWEAKKEKLVGHSIARNYPEILGIEGTQLTKEQWPNKNWIKNGRLYIYHLPSATSTTS